MGLDQVGRPAQLREPRGEPGGIGDGVVVALDRDGDVEARELSVRARTPAIVSRCSGACSRW